MAKKKKHKTYTRPGPAIRHADMGDTAMAAGLGALGAVGFDIATGWADQKGYTNKLPGTTTTTKNYWKAGIGLAVGYLAKDYAPEVGLGMMIGAVRSIATPMAQSAVLGTTTTTTTIVNTPSVPQQLGTGTGTVTPVPTVNPVLNPVIS